jgi:uncharacterized RDD family membrane protein YckC
METPKETLTIQTPEYVGFQYTLAGLGSRAIAYLLDTAVRLIFVLCIFILILTFSRWLPALDPEGIAGRLSKNWIMALGVIAYGVIDLGYFLLFEALWSGQTPGKRQQKLRVIRKNGQPIGWLESAIRNILRAIDILFGFYPLGLIVMFLSHNTQRIGDYAAGTVVIVDRARNTIGDRSRDQSAGIEPRQDIEANLATLKPRQYQIIRSFLQRREGMDDAHRHQLARLLAHRLIERWGGSYQLDISYEAFLEEVVRSYERHRRAV